MYSRPKVGETEEDSLQLQEEFLQKKAENAIKPAATVVSEKKNEKKNLEKDLTTDVQEQLANTFEAVPQDVKLGTIVENQTQSRSVSQFKFNKTRGFPQAKRRDDTIVPNKGSIFSQHMKRLKKNENPMDIDVTPISNNSLHIKENIENAPTNLPQISLPEQSYILTGNESKDIHTENLNLLKGLSEREIIEERNKLLETMDPDIVRYLKSLRSKEKNHNKNPSIKEQNAAGECLKIEEIEATVEMLNQPKAEKWLNFDVVESNKLAWMKNINIPKLDKEQSFEARFDFEGWLLPYSEPDINEKNRILYHHGEEPGRPGYTLQELFQLARSTVVQQKIIALNTIANILSLHSTGLYDDIIDIPIEHTFFVIRFCLDENTPSVLNSSIKALRNLFCNQVDEVCLDSLLGFGVSYVQPILAIDNETEDDNTVNDQQLSETNLVKCLARSDILIRIRYIINTVKPFVETIIYCMDILVRLARDSQFILNKVYNCEGLISSIINHFIPMVQFAKSSDSPYGLPLLQSVKLLRILASRSKNIAIDIVNKYTIMNSIVLYLSGDSFSLNANGMRLQSECFHFWSVLVKYNLALDYFSVLEPVIMNMLDYHFKNTDLDMKTTFVRNSYVAGLFLLIGNVANKNINLVKNLVPLIGQCFSKWVVQFTKLNDFACGKLQILSSIFYCISWMRRSNSTENELDFKKVDDSILFMLKSNGFNVVTKNILNCSMLLNNYDIHKSSSNLKTIEAASWYTAEHVVPIIQTKSCLPFLLNLSEYVLLTNNHKVKLCFLQNENTRLYLDALKTMEQYYLTSNWFTRTEVFLLMNILKISVEIQENVDTSIFYELAVKCLCTFTSEQKEDIKFVLSNIIFCSKFYPSEVLLKNLDISQRNESLEISLSHLGEILDVYAKVLGVTNNIADFSACLSLDISIGSVIPIDWIYTPIIVLYSDQQQNKQQTSEEQQIYIIRNCLRWILIYETHFPILASSVNVTDRFCRLACVFLGSDSLFLSKEIHTLLELCFKNVMLYEKDLNFKKEIQGLSNFQDFYTQLLGQYQGVSYGDVLFGNVILVPLAQKHIKQYKKTLWSEYIGVVQILNVTNEQLLSSLESYLEPCEEDMSLLKSYQSALMNSNIRKTSVLYQIATHHVKQFMIRNKK